MQESANLTLSISAAAPLVSRSPHVTGMVTGGLLALVLAVILLAATALLCNKKKRLGSGSTNNKERNKVSI